MDKIRVLIASPVCQDPLVLEKFLISLKNVDIEGLKTCFFFIDDNNIENSKSLLKDFQAYNCAIDIFDTNNSDEYLRTEVTHKWSDGLVEKVAKYRNTILSKARENNSDYLFMVDSDLLLHQNTLKHLINQDKDIISEIFWTTWAPGGKEYPQVWLYDHYTLYELGKDRFLSDSEISLRTTNFLNKLRVPGVYKVGGLGACTLISKKVLNSNISYSNLPNLSFWGEDRHFCIRAAALGFDLYVDTHYPAYHIYRKSELNGAEIFKQKCGYTITSLKHRT